MFIVNEVLEINFHVKHVSTFYQKICRIVFDKEVRSHSFKRENVLEFTTKHVN